MALVDVDQKIDLAMMYLRMNGFLLGLNFYRSYKSTY